MYSKLNLKTRNVFEGWVLHDWIVDSFYWGCLNFSQRCPNVVHNVKSGWFGRRTLRVFLSSCLLIKMETREDCFNWLDFDVIMVILMCLGDPADFIRVSSLSRFWYNFGELKRFICISISTHVLCFFRRV